MKYLGTYSQIEHLLEEARYYLLFNNSEHPGRKKKAREVVLVKYEDGPRIFVIKGYRGLYGEFKGFREFIKLEAYDGGGSLFFPRDEIFSLSDYDIAIMLMESI